MINTPSVSTNEIDYARLLFSFIYDLHVILNLLSGELHKQTKFIDEPAFAVNSQMRRAAGCPMKTQNNWWRQNMDESLPETDVEYASAMRLPG